LILAYLPFERSALERAVPVDFGGVVVSAATREFSIFPTSLMIAFSVICIAVIAVGLRSELRGGRASENPKRVRMTLTARD
jgi:hypothetical protein